jgi:hypothetical protein
MTSQLSKNLYSTMCDPVVDMIVSYLPLAEQKAISKKYRIKIVSINKIVQAIRNNRMRMDTIMEYELPCSAQLMRAHYLLHYPDDLKYSYFRMAMMKLVRLDDGISFLPYSQYLSIANNEDKNLTGFSDKYLFKRLINIMTVEELIICGW